MSSHKQQSNKQQSNTLADQKAQAETKKLHTEAEKIGAEITKLKLESKELMRRWPRWVSILMALSTALISGLGVIFADRQAEKNREQAQMFHDDELFSKAEEQFRSSKLDQRGPAIMALVYHAKTSARNRGIAIALIAPELQRDQDPEVLGFVIQALPDLGPSTLEALIKKNRSLYEHLSRVIGRYLGIQRAFNRIKIVGRPTSDEAMAVYLFKLSDSSARAMLSWQEASTSDADFFQTPDQIAINQGFKKAFLQVSPRKATRKDEVYAESEFREGLRDLWKNTQAIVSILRSLSGNLAGVNLRKTILLRPHLGGIDLHGIDARYAIWMAPILTGANLRFANLSGAEMKYAEIAHADMTGADVGQANFGRRDRDIETRSLANIAILQDDVNLDGVNFWEMASSHLRDRRLNVANLRQLKEHRQQILASSDAQRYLSKIPSIGADD